MADACPFAVLAPLVLSGDGLCGRLRRGMSENDAGRNQNTVATVIDVWSLAHGEATTALQNSAYFGARTQSDELHPRQPIMRVIM